MLLEVDCNSKKTRSLAGVVYYKLLYYPDGRQEKFKISQDIEETPNSLFKIVAPGSVAEVFVETVCKL